MIEDDSSESGEEFEAPYWPANKLDAEGENVMSGGADPCIRSALAAARDELARVITGVLGTMEQIVKDSYDSAGCWTPELDARVQKAHDGVAALLAAAERGEEDTARIEWQEQHSFRTFNVAGDLRAVVSDKKHANYWGDTIREAVDAARSATPTEGDDHA